MQRLAPQLGPRRANPLVFRWPSVQGVPDDRMTCVAQVHANLMRAPRLKPTLHQARPLETFEELDMRHRPLPALDPA